MMRVNGSRDASVHMVQNQVEHERFSTTAIYAVGKEEQHIAARMWG